MKKTVYLIGLVIALGGSAQDKTAIKFAKTITAADLESHLSVLASDEYEGRETGKKGQKMAAEYIAEHFEKLGIEAPVDGSYLQKFDLVQSQLEKVYLQKEGDEKKGFRDFLYYSKAETMGEEYIKVVMAAQASDKKLFKGAYVVFVSEEFGGFGEFIEEAKEAGAKGFVLILQDDEVYESLLSRVGPYFQRPSMGTRDNEAAKLIVGKTDLAEWMFGKPLPEIKEGATTYLIFNADYLDKPVSTENVLGFLRGSEKPEEVLVITSHYDHIGVIDGEVNNGADDDGSGTVTVLEIAEAFTKSSEKNKGPKRSILFMTVTGEEKGLLGSKYYTDTDPIFPLEHTVANLNIDMVGRIDPEHEENPEYIYLIGSDKLSTELHQLSERMNQTYTNLEL
ncbi:MAG: M28 family peptidase, partial [Ekhidna sp.]|nr:M28 family peptidase [Ekhidna sp.]